jgi:hypothetical protein
MKGSKETLGYCTLVNNNNNTQEQDDHRKLEIYSTVKPL